MRWQHCATGMLVSTRLKMLNVKNHASLSSYFTNVCVLLSPNLLHKIPIRCIVCGCKMWKISKIQFCFFWQGTYRLGNLSKCMYEWKKCVVVLLLNNCTLKRVVLTHKNNIRYKQTNTNFVNGFLQFLKLNSLCMKWIILT